MLLGMYNFEGKIRLLDMMYKPDDGVGSSGGGSGGLGGGALVVVLGEMLVTSWSSIDQELPTFSRLWLRLLMLWRLPTPPAAAAAPAAARGRVRRRGWSHRRF